MERVLAQQMTSGFRKRQPARLVDLGLHHVGNDLLDRIFDGDDVPRPRFGEGTQTGVDGGGLPAAGRTGQKQQPGALAEERFQFHADRFGETQFTQRRRVGGVEQS